MRKAIDVRAAVTPTQEERERAFKALSGWPFGGTFSALYDIVCQLLADSREVDKARIKRLEEGLRECAKDASWDADKGVFGEDAARAAVMDDARRALAGEP